MPNREQKSQPARDIPR